MKDRKHQLRLITVSAVSLGMIAMFAVGAIGSSNKAPSKPPYTLINGAPDIRSLPSRVPVAGPNGNPIATVPRSCLFTDSPNPDCDALPLAGDDEITTQSFGPDEAP